jgi:hypothetical protein
VNIAAVKADHERRCRFWQFVPLVRTPLDKRRLFVAQLALKTLSHLMNMT